jgi:hypothetical protein
LNDTYFLALQEFVDITEDASVGGPYPFDRFAWTDMELVVRDLELASEAPNRRLRPTARQ